MCVCILLSSLYICQYIIMSVYQCVCLFLYLSVCTVSCLSISISVYLYPPVANYWGVGSEWFLATSEGRRTAWVARRPPQERTKKKKEGGGRKPINNDQGFLARIFVSAQAPRQEKRPPASQSRAKQAKRRMTTTHTSVKVPCIIPYQATVLATCRTFYK